MFVCARVSSSFILFSSTELKSSKTSLSSQLLFTSPAAQGSNVLVIGADAAQGERAGESHAFSASDAELSAQKPAQSRSSLLGAPSFLEE